LICAPTWTGRRRFAIQLHRLRRIERHAVAGFVQGAERGLRVVVAGRGAALQIGERLRGQRGGQKEVQSKGRSMLGPL
jgi:hypothetical protein